MYHQQHNRAPSFLPIVLVIISLTCISCRHSVAAPDERRCAPAVQTLRQAPDYPLLPSRKELKQKPQEATIYQLDISRLENRRPLLLVHGLRGEYRPIFRWDQIVKHLQNNQEFSSRFKIYLLRYDSTSSLQITAPQFKNALLQLSEAAGGKQVAILALSLGGNLVEEAILDPQVDSVVQTVFALGTPFHGSPLFSYDWYQYSLYKNLSLPWTRVDHSLSYRLYFHCNPLLLQELHWDNADGYIPEAGPFRSLLPFGPQGNLTVARNANARLLRLHTESGQDKSKFITYAGYLLNPYLQPTLRRQFEITVLAPYTFLTVHLPAHLAREHPVLKMLNHEISRTVPKEVADPKPDNWPHIYGLNDGITPVNSALFLPAATLKANPIEREDDVPRLRNYTDVRLARVFRNIDHLTFIDGYRPGVSSHLLRDELNPQDGYRRIFDWILTDILHSEPLPNHLARDATSANNTPKKTLD